MSADLRKVHESPRELRFAYSHATGWVVASIGATIAGYGAVGMEGAPEWSVFAVGALFLVAGAVSAFYRMELAFDLTRRRYRYRRGFLPAPREGEGSFDDIEAVVLKKELESRGSDRVDDWEVELVLRDWARPVELAEMRDEESARREAERLASRLGVPLTERTGY